MFFMTTFWLGTMAGVTALHWLLPARWRGWDLVVLTAAFLAWKSPASLFILTVTTLVLHGLAGRENRISGKRLAFLIALVAAVLSYYKIQAGVSIGANTGAADHLIPLGLSYYAFRVLHYAIEKYKGTIPAHKFTHTAQYLFFLPTLVIGPIHRFPAFTRDLGRKRWDPFMLAEGIERLIFGYVKIAFIANLVLSNLLIDWIAAHTVDESGLRAYLEAVRYVGNLYFLFSGASDIAIGFGLMLGFRIMENFNFPFLARNISDFWTRWHISLTSWCRDYVYMGVIALSRRPSLAALAAMLVMGLWHEFSLRYILWGVYQGLGIFIWQRFQGLKPRLPHIENRLAQTVLQILSTLLTLHYVMIGMIFVSKPDTVQALEQIRRILLFWM